MEPFSPKPDKNKIKTDVKNLLNGIIKSDFENNEVFK